MSTLRGFVVIDRLRREYIRRSTRPIVVGPWRSEVGFEVLYHLPYLGWLLKGIAQKRVYVITRGGAGIWYPVNQAKVLDLYKIRPLEEVRRQTNLDIVRHQMMKHTRISAWDRDVIKQACGIWGIEHPILVHPSETYRRFGDWFASKATAVDTLSRMHFAPIKKPEHPPEGLPKKYYVSHFYSRATLKASPEVRRFISDTLVGLSERAPVIQLLSPHHVDDHIDIPIKHDKVLVATKDGQHPSPAETLSHNSALIAGSAGFVGTYGGMAQVALRYGIPSLSFYETLEGTSPQHLVLSQMIGYSTNTPFYAVKMSDIGLFSHVWKGLSS